MDKDKLLGRVFKYTNPDQCISILQQFQPVLKQVRLVPHVYNEVQKVHATESDEDRRLIFIATVYQLYSPISYLKVQDGEKVAGKLPAGLRDMVRDCLNLPHSEEVNRYKGFTDSWMRPFNTGPERPFKTKVQKVVDRFRQL